MAMLLTEADLAWLGRALLHEAVQSNRIIQSIKNRVVNKIYYSGDEGQVPGWRSVEIFAYGRNKAGNDVIRAWLREGTSATPQGNGRDPLRNKPGWRLFRVDRISSFQNTNQRFVADSAVMSERNYNPHDKDLVTIHYALESPSATTTTTTSPTEPTTPAAPTPPPAPTTPGPRPLLGNISIKNEPPAPGV
jgi:hypothetical protein